MKLLRGLRNGGTLAGMLLLAGMASAGTGDVNADGRVNRADALLALRAAGGLVTPTFAQYAAANTVSDGRVQVVDAVRIARIAAGRDTAAPAASQPTTFSLKVTANAPRNIALPGGYTVSGRVLDTNAQPFAGSIGFLETGTKATFGPFTLDSTGAYSAVLPPGTYQAIGVTQLEDASGSGETSLADVALTMGSAITVTADATNRNFTRPSLPARATVRLSFSGPSQPVSISARITLTETTFEAPSYGLDDLVSEVSFTPANRLIPAGTYHIDSLSRLGLSTGMMEDFYLSFASPVTVGSGTTSRTLVYPTTYELSGTFSGSSSSNVVDVLVEQVPQTGKDRASANIQAPGVSYRVAIPAGAATVSVGLATPYAETMGEWIIPYTMPAKSAVQDVSLPALPAFRTVTGQVLGADGAAVSGATVRADTVLPATIPAAGTFAFHASTTTDASGNYTVRLPDGTYTVSVTL